MRTKQNNSVNYRLSYNSKILLVACIVYGVCSAAMFIGALYANRCAEPKAKHVEYVEIQISYIDILLSDGSIKPKIGDAIQRSLNDYIDVTNDYYGIILYSLLSMGVLSAIFSFISGAAARSLKRFSEEVKNDIADR